MARQTVFTDDFNRADQDVDVSSDWQQYGQANICVIRSNALTTRDPSGSAEYTGELEVDQWVQATMAELPQGQVAHYMSLFVRSSVQATYTLQVHPTSLYIHLAPADQNVASHSYTRQAGDVYRLEAEGNAIRAYVNDTEVMTATDSTAAVGSVGVKMNKPTEPWETGRWDDFSCGNFSSGFSLGDVNGDNTVRSMGDIVVSGSLLDTVTVIEITDGVDPHQLQITGQSASQITCAPFSILDTKLAYATAADGTISISATDGATVQSTGVKLLQETGYEYQILSGVDDTLLAEGLGAVDGDILEVEDGVVTSNLILFADSDCHYDPAVMDGQTHTRRFYDASAKTWDSGICTINATAGPVPLPPSWGAVPNLPNARKGEPYTYAIGVHLAGDRPMTLTDAGTLLSEWGLAYDDTVEPEIITGTPTQDGTIDGIVTRAENSV